MHEPPTLTPERTKYHQGYTGNGRNKQGRHTEDDQRQSDHDKDGPAQPAPHGRALVTLPKTLARPSRMKLAPFLFEHIKHNVSFRFNAQPPPAPLICPCKRTLANEFRPPAYPLYIMVAPVADVTFVKSLKQSSPNGPSGAHRRVGGAGPRASLHYPIEKYCRFLPVS